ncbi:TetR/AcrR family transcriptional regulator [Actinomadura sp. 21ATH]|uniref:TetR/AcrR family transcriptional regulator n=1 Tax=Actinomadura sp. 21ATH TaxID=1735444 RepID=UPI0035BEC4A0
MRTISGYHHGNLRRTIIDAAVEAIADSGTATWSLRELARRAGVSHAAPAHHFGDKAGLLTAVAAEGYRLFADTLAAAGDDFLEVGTAYVRFATERRGYFEVMFRPTLYRADDPEVAAGRAAASAILARGARAEVDDPDRAPMMEVAAWSIVHGFAELWLSGALGDDVGPSPVRAAREMLQVMYDRR